MTDGDSPASLFADPPCKYRPVPFWSWNDRLDEAEVRRQIREMHRVGIGGYFMHARGGLKTPYMGEQWMRAIRAGIEEGTRLGMHPWAYDENGWPSGFADGAVTGKGIEYQQKYLRFERDTGPLTQRRNTVCCIDCKTGSFIDAPEHADGEIYHLWFDVNPFYVDTLDPEVTAAFLDACHETYQRELEPGLWEGLAGFFTDEPQVSRNGIPWSFVLPHAYADAYGEELLPRLPELFVDIGQYRRTRYRFWRLVTRLFRDSYMKQLFSWCEQHGVLLTGHQVSEESCDSQLTSNGAVMPHYEFYHIPGMDWLGRRIDPVTTPVQVASACAQLGRRQVLSETFGLCGWNVSFEALKWIYQWQMVHGINLLCQHLEGYSLRGIRKRDYPASLFYQQPWWPRYKSFNDYVSRIGALLAEGECRVELLVVHGQCSAWTAFHGNADDERIGAYNSSLLATSNGLDSAHLEYHYGDEILLERYGRVNRDRLVVGECSYKAVALPQVSTLTASTVRLLSEFVAAGGTVAGVRNRIEERELCVDGQERDDVRALARRIAWFDSEDQLVKELARSCATLPAVPAGTPPDRRHDVECQIGPIHCTRRDFADFDGRSAVLYYYVNNSTENGVNVDVVVSGAQVEQLVPETGERQAVCGRREDNEIVVRHYFPPMGALLLLTRFDPAPGEGTALLQAPPLTGRPPADWSSGRQPIELDGTWHLKLESENALTLDTCAFWFDGDLQEECESVSVIQDRLLRMRRPVEVRMRFEFEADPEGSGDEFMGLVLERPELYDIRINGSPCDAETTTMYRDISFRRIPVASLVRPGRNSIELEMTFTQSDTVYENVEKSRRFESEKNKLTYDMEIESMYLVGNFGVAATGPGIRLERDAIRYKGPFRLTAVPEAADNRELLAAGLPFFNGTAMLEREINLPAEACTDRVLCFDRLLANHVDVEVNGRSCGSLFWRPYAVDLSGVLREGRNVIRLRLTNSLRNLLGPHHLEEGECYAVGPWCFFKEEGVFARRWDGKLSEWNDDYCLARFGVEGIRIV